jgi:hypothetical protein
LPSLDDGTTDDTDLDINIQPPYTILGYTKIYDMLSAEEISVIKDGKWYIVLPAFDYPNDTF